MMGKRRGPKPGSKWSVEPIDYAEIFETLSPGSVDVGLNYIRTGRGKSTGAFPRGHVYKMNDTYEGNAWRGSSNRKTSASALFFSN